MADQIGDSVTVAAYGSPAEQAKDKLGRTDHASLKVTYTIADTPKGKVLHPTIVDHLGGKGDKAVDTALGLELRKDTPIAAGQDPGTALADRGKAVEKQFQNTFGHDAVVRRETFALR